MATDGGRESGTEPPEDVAPTETLDTGATQRQRVRLSYNRGSVLVYGNGVLGWWKASDEAENVAPAPRRGSAQRTSGQGGRVAGWQDD